MLTPAPANKILRRMNFISDQKGIMNRFLREQGAWDGHLTEAGNFIIKVLQQEKVEHIVLLGSGWLLDFPIEKIIPLVKRITLVDVYFPPQILRKTESFEEVECLPADITGGYIETIYKNLKEQKGDFVLPAEHIQPHITPEKGKLVISLNIMNQLDILLVDYIRSKVIIDEAAIAGFRTALQQAHLNMLKEHPFILITDYSELLINTQGNVIEDKELIFVDFPFCSLSREWEWQFDSHKLYNAHADTRMMVRAMFSEGPRAQ
jgi:hypothetical protein